MSDLIVSDGTITISQRAAERLFVALKQAEWAGLLSEDWERQLLKDLRQVNKDPAWKSL